MNKSILFHEERPPPVAAVTVLLHNEKESFPQGRGKAPRFTSSSLSPHSQISFIAQPPSSSDTPSSLTPYLDM